MDNNIKTFYGKVADYNRCRILKEVRSLIVADGGEDLTPVYKPVKCYLKAYTNETSEEKISAVENLPVLEKNIFSEYSSDWGDSLYFILDGYYYYVGYDENPFFPIIFMKAKIDQDGCYYGSRYYNSSDSINDAAWKKEKNIVFSIGYDNLFKIVSDNDIMEMARHHYESIKKYVINGRESATVSQRKRQYNYNGSYYYKNIYDNKKHNVLVRSW